MRIFVAAFVLVLAACSQPSSGASAPASTSAAPAPNSASTIAASAVTLTPAAIGGQWSFDGTCGVYDLVFTNTGATYYNYMDEAHVVTWDGGYTTSGNRVDMSLRRLDAQGAPAGPAQTYSLEVSSLQGDSLSGQLAYAIGDDSERRTFTAKRCDNAEDRE